MLTSAPIEIPGVAGTVVMERSAWSCRVLVDGIRVPRTRREFELPTEGRFKVHAIITRGTDPFPALRIGDHTYVFGPHNPFWIRAVAWLPLLLTRLGTAGFVAGAIAFFANAYILTGTTWPQRWKAMAIGAVCAATIPIMATLGLSPQSAWDRWTYADAHSSSTTFTQNSDSMAPLLTAGQTFTVMSVKTYVPHRGDVVVFNVPSDWGPSGEKVYRVIAIGGDRITCCTNATSFTQLLTKGGSGGSLVLNGKPLDESAYLSPGVDPSGGVPFAQQRVPQGELWLMGDNRDQASYGSAGFITTPGGPFVPASDVIGIYKP